MKIKFINHASAIFDCGDVKILTDPWYTGSCFNNGWNLMVDNKIDINDLDFNYLWYSHEHPDHFSIADLRKISEQKKKEITILFQFAPDQKVKKFCEKLGFKVVEIEEGKDFFIEDVKICIGKEGGFDSWISITHEDKTIVNLNDCRLENEEELAPLKKLGKIDVLLTQFGVANWTGNDGDLDAISTAQEMIFQKTNEQIKHLKPEYIVPFASFSWFSHEENSFCNNAAIPIKYFVDYYSYTKKIITLYVGEEWVVGEDRNCSEGVWQWEEQFKKKREPIHKSITINEEELQQSFEFMRSKLKKNNSWDKLIELHSTFEGAVVELTDTEEKYIFDISKKSLEKTASQSADISMGSESFNYLMRNEWGRGTLMVNGRFQASYKNFYKFLRQTQVYYNNNIGKRYPEDIPNESITNPRSFVYETLDTINNN